MVYVGENVYKCTLYLCNVSKFKKCRKKGCNFYYGGFWRKCFYLEEFNDKIIAKCNVMRLR